MKWPIFVSIGNPDKLEKFLEANPTVDRGTILVDDYDHALYKGLGFDRFDRVDVGMEDLSRVGKLLRFLTLGTEGLYNYAKNVPDLVPVEGRVDWSDLPEGGMRNGGTLVASGNDIVYRWSDKIPGDVPDVQDVLRRAKEMEMDRAMR